MSTKNARILGIRLDEKTNERLLKFEEATLIEGVSLARASLIAALDSFEANQSLTLPLKIVSAPRVTVIETLSPAPAKPSTTGKPSSVLAEDRPITDRLRSRLGIKKPEVISTS